MSKTIEEKAIAYNKAIEKAREYWETDDDNTLDIKARGTMEYLFPELVESEGERIRKEILEVAKTVVSRDGTLYGKKYNCREWIAWLEKQGNPNTEYWKGYKDGKKAILDKYSETHKVVKPKFKVGDIISNGKAVYRVDNIVKNCLGQDSYFLVNVEMEKNGTRYLIITDSEGKTSYMGEITWLCEQVDKSFEKQDEQKSTDELKFKVGDWVVNDEDGDVQQIIEIQRINEFIFYKCDNIFFNKPAEKYWRLWTINDAKPGDVLKEDSCTFIIERMNPDGTAIVHCCLFDDGDFDLGSTLSFDVDSTYPATKEQRDLLFQKMCESGYEWDSKNKMLNKIHIIDEDKAEMDYCFTKMMNGEKVSPKDEEYNGEDYGIDGLWHAMNILERTLGKVDGYQTDDGFLSHQCAITAVKKLYEQKSAAWSKEDGRMFDYALDMIEWYSGKNGDKSKLVSNWLKSLKDRIQPKQEWSKEDKERFISCLKRLGSGNPEQLETINSKWFKEHVYPQKQWKPNDEQMRAFKQMYDWYNTHFAQSLALNSLYNDLKKLKGE